MYRGQIIFAELMQFVRWKAFARIVAHYRGDRGVRNLNCVQQFCALAFAQLTHRRSLRDLAGCLDSVPAKLYHVGFIAPARVRCLALLGTARMPCTAWPPPPAVG